MCANNHDMKINTAKHKSGITSGGRLIRKYQKMNVSFAIYGSLSSLASITESMAQYSEALRITSFIVGFKSNRV
jgi:hypothetical protein